jgi:hypothetical protein
LASLAPYIFDEHGELVPVLIKITKKSCKLKLSYDRLLNGPSIIIVKATVVIIHLSKLLMLSCYKFQLQKQTVTVYTKGRFLNTFFSFIIASCQKLKNTRIKFFTEGEQNSVITFF